MKSLNFGYSTAHKLSKKIVMGIVVIVLLICATVIGCILSAIWFYGLVQTIYLIVVVLLRIPREYCPLQGYLGTPHIWMGVTWLTVHILGFGYWVAPYIKDFANRLDDME